ncbi:conserved hypothetical protein [Mesorhizobium prunaredense]|uniref:Uncharacterized protein n=1 Tax=Mesorhizobium prunaredense TaxID=1631249 RepID=A0A1R3VBD4_9HYPH|nr:hypothetical protein [Mesorhizobium prunaredense]SIT57203.1 conserved hypothetical protein [Mesorhizobium prunaredense]
MNKVVPTQFDAVRERARRAVAPLKPVDANSEARQDFLFSAQRAVGPDGLPPPHLIYFLLVELLGFRDLGRFEKLAWSIPVDCESKAFLIEHRKFGVGVFTQDAGDLEAAKRIAILVKKGVRRAEPYFKWKADQAVAASQFNVVNNAGVLLRRYQYLKAQFDAARAEAERRKDEAIETKFGNATSYKRPYHGLAQEAQWLAMAAIDAFFSWTEHIFVHLAILNGAITTGVQFSGVSGAEWGVKFKQALDLGEATTKNHFDGLVDIRRQLRNFVAHGAFGKDGETLYFHSSAGAVPVLLDVTAKASKFSLNEELEFDAAHAFAATEGFIAYLSAGPCRPAWVYVQEFGLPLILTMAQDGTYRDAMASPEEMERFAYQLASRMDDAANMDW